MAIAQPPAHDPAAIEARVDKLVSQMTVDEKISFIAGDTPFRTYPIPRLGIPFFQMADGPVGAHIPAPTIAYAAGIGLAASWDTALADRIGTQLGRDTRSRGAVFILGPGVNIYRAPMNGRNFEYFGEDPFLASRIAVGYIEGVQSQGVSATVKHFLGNNSEFLRHDSDSIISQRALHEIYEPTFEAAVKEAHVGAIMDSYNLTNGEHMTQNAPLNIDLVKHDWHYPGIIMSDWVATYDTAAPANAGMDLEMPFGAYFNKEKLLPLLKDGTVTQATIDDKVRRILRVAVTFGWLDTPAMDITIPRYNLQGRAASMQGALEGTVLLRNASHALPIDKSTLHTVAVLGPTAAQTVTTGGGSGEVVSFANTNLLTGISNALEGKADVLYSRGLYTPDQMAQLTHFTTDEAGTTPGALHQIYSQAQLAGDLVSTVTERNMVQSGSSRRLPEVQEINAFYMHRGQDPYHQPPISSRWTGYYTPDAAGEFAVFVQTDAKFRLLIDGKTVIDSSETPRAILNQLTMHLTRGAHKVVVEVLSQTFGSATGVRCGIYPLDKIVDPQALAIAKRADVVVIAVGFDNFSESEGGDRSFDLPIGQQQLIQAVAALGKKTVVAITSGGSVNVTPWQDKVQGIFATWYAGEEGGKAFAKLLFGEANPSGHLPISWERKLTDNPSYAHYYTDPGTDKIVYRDGIFVGYRGYEHAHIKPLFPFGYGLSYTTFQFAHLHAEPAGDHAYDVTFDVTNTGPRAGAAVPQLYVGEVHPAVERPAKELKAFDRVQLAPGETKHVTLHLAPRAFAYFDESSKDWHIDRGAFRLSLGSSSEDTPHEVTVNIAQETHLSVSQ